MPLYDTHDSRYVGHLLQPSQGLGVKPVRSLSLNLEFTFAGLPSLR